MATPATTIRWLRLLTGLNIIAWSIFGAAYLLRWHVTPAAAPSAVQIFPGGELRIAVDASYPPFALDEGGRLSGIDIDLGRALAQEVGLTARFINMGYDGLYDALKANQADIVISALVVDPLRTRDVRYTRAYFDNGLVLASSMEAPIRQAESIPGRSIAYEFGSEADTMIRRLERRIGSFEALPYERPTYALDAARLAQADAALVDHTTLRLYLREHTGWDAARWQVTHVPYAIAVRHDRPEAWELIDQALAELIRQGVIRQILEKWL